MEEGCEQASGAQTPVEDHLEGVDLSPNAKRQLFKEPEQDIMNEGGKTADYFVEIPEDGNAAPGGELTVYQVPPLVQELVSEMAVCSLKRKREGENSQQQPENVTKKVRFEELPTQKVQGRGKTKKVGGRPQNQVTGLVDVRVEQAQEGWQLRKSTLPGETVVFNADKRSGGRPTSTTEAP